MLQVILEQCPLLQAILGVILVSELSVQSGS